LHLGEKFLRGRCGLGMERVDSTCAVVDEADHGEGYGDATIRGLEDGAIGTGLMAIEESGADYWRVSAFLAGAV
jgi:hypothetical protein